MSEIKVQNLKKSFGSVPALKGVSLEIPEGSLAAILGPSGCGKSTFLRLLAGLESPTSGAIWVGGEEVTNKAPEKRRVGMMFQSYALFPHMTVNENLRFPLRMQRTVPHDQQQRRIDEALTLVQMEGLGDRYPRQLSGGQQQRVAFARAVIGDPRALLLDEPLSNLDAKLREEMQVELIDLHRKLGITTVLVTHDQDEALSLADTVVLMNKGVIEQQGAPEEIYRRPRSAFAADFLGAANLLPVDVAQQPDGSWRAEPRSGGSSFPVLAPPEGRPGPHTLLLRQEDLNLTAEPAAWDVAVPGEVETRAYRGSNIRYIVNSLGVRLKVTADAGNGSATAEPTHVAWRIEDAALLPEEKAT